MAGAFRLTLKEMCSDYSDMSFEEMERLYIEHEDRIHSHLE